MIIHEIAAAYIVGGFIMVFAPGAKGHQWFYGMLVIILASLGSLSK